MTKALYYSRVRGSQHALGASSLKRDDATRRRNLSDRGSPLSVSGLLGITIVLAVIAFRLHELLPPQIGLIRPALIVGPAVLYVVARQSSVTFHQVLREDILARAAIVFFGWAAITVPFAEVKGMAFAGLELLFPSLLMVASFCFVAPTERNLEWCTRAFAFCGACMAGAALVVGSTTFDGRLMVTRSLDPNDVAATLCMVVPICLGVASRLRLRWKVFPWAVAAISIWVIVKTGSRGGAIGVAAAVVSLILLANKRTMLVQGAFVFVAGGVFWQSAPVSFRERIASIGNLENDYNTQSYVGRQQIWQRGIGYGISNPVFGLGLTNFPVAEGQTLESMGRRGKWSAAHNSFVQVFAELGYAGLALFLWLVTLMLRSGWRWRRGVERRGLSARPELLASSIGFLCAAFFLSAAYSWALYALLGLNGLAIRIEHKSSS